MTQTTPDPRDARPESEMAGRDPIFRDHNCWKCTDGRKPCPQRQLGHHCEYPLARND